MSQDKISIIGIGRLGVCAALQFANAGYDVLGCDINPSYVEKLNEKSFNSPEPGVSKALQESKNFVATVDIGKTLNHSDLIWIFVDTPTGGMNGKSYDTTKLSTVLQTISKKNVENKHIMIGCTVQPGYINEIGNFLVSNLKNCTLNYNPEFIAQGAIMHGFVNPDMVLIGAATPEAALKIKNVYEKTVQNNPKYCVMSPASAEITKLALNCFVTMKIAYCNSIGDLADATKDANSQQILEAIGFDSRIGSKCMRPGYGFGGPCFPRDNRALGSYAKSIGQDPLLMNATDESNDQHRERQIKQLLKTFDIEDELLFKEVTYKPNCPVPIIEQSQKLMIAAELARAGRKITICDREDVLDAVKREYGYLFKYKVWNEDDSSLLQGFKLVEEN